MSYDDWLEAPYQRLYARPQREDLDEVIGEVVEVYGDSFTVEAFEVTTEADEDGQWDAVTFELFRANGSVIYHSESEVLDLLAAKGTS